MEIYALFFFRPGFFRTFVDTFPCFIFYNIPISYMPRHLAHITLLILLTLISSCRNESYDRQMRQNISRAQTLVDSMPDSTLSILRDVDISTIDREKARIHYLIGCAKLRLQNYPDAMWSLLHAERTATENDDYAMLALSRLKMMELYDSLYDYKTSGYYASAALEAYGHIASDREKSAIDSLTNGISIDMLAATDTLSDTGSDAQSSTHPATRHTDNLTEMLCNDCPADSLSLPDSLMLSVSDLHMILSRLWEKGDDKTAQRFLNCYLHSSNSHDGTMFCPYDCHDNKNRQARVYVNQTLTQRHIMESFQREASYTMAKFNYGENLLKDQSLRIHRLHLWFSLSFIVVLIIIIVLILKLSRARRLRREEEYIRTALELQTALSRSQNRCLSTLTHLCNTYYEGFNRESVKSKAAKEALEAIEAFADSDKFFAYLESRLNSECYGLMTRFRSEMPDLREADYRLFLCNALGLSIPTICLLLKEKREVIYNRRLRLRTKIQTSASPDTETFLQYLK